MGRPLRRRAQEQALTCVSDRFGHIIEELARAKNSVDASAISGGMIPKVETGITAIERGAGTLIVQ